MREKITAEWLREMGACESHIIKFEGLFRRGCVFSKANLQTAYGAGLDIDWIGGHILTKTGDTEFCSVHPDAEALWDLRRHIQAKYRRKFGIK